nr:MAG TPA: hypothetical protein [Caudoviricetes sp.]DAR80235.1 MAG TPA: hypothetical protein [Caudoviricetes sp.]
MASRFATPPPPHRIPKAGIPALGRQGCSHPLPSCLIY